MEASRQKTQSSLYLSLRLQRDQRVGRSERCNGPKRAKMKIINRDRRGGLQVEEMIYPLQLPSASSERRVCAARRSVGAGPHRCRRSTAAGRVFLRQFICCKVTVADGVLVLHDPLLSASLRCFVRVCSSLSPALLFVSAGACVRLHLIGGFFFENHFVFPW